MFCQALRFAAGSACSNFLAVFSARLALCLLGFTGGVLNHAKPNLLSAASASSAEV